MKGDEILPKIDKRSPMFIRNSTVEEITAIVLLNLHSDRSKNSHH